MSLLRNAFCSFKALIPARTSYPSSILSLARNVPGKSIYFENEAPFRGRFCNNFQFSSSLEISSSWICSMSCRPLQMFSGVLEKTHNYCLSSLHHRTCSTLSFITEQEWYEQRQLQRLHERGPKPIRKRRHPLDEKCQMRGIVLKTVIKKPKKPNSANRKCVLVRLTNGKEATAFVPKIGHNLQEHSVVLVQNRRTKDVPGLKLRCIRGAYDLPHVVKKKQTPV